MQTEKQRIIWAYKILFLDVLFPLGLKKVIFLDADQIIRTDIAELWNLDLKVGSVCEGLFAMDGQASALRALPGCRAVVHCSQVGTACKGCASLSTLTCPVVDARVSPQRYRIRTSANMHTCGTQGAPYGYTPFCDNNKDMDGFRFWRQGFWKDHLRGKPYHISALYVVDLARFRLVCCPPYDTDGNGIWGSPGSHAPRRANPLPPSVAAKSACSVCRLTRRRHRQPAAAASWVLPMPALIRTQTLAAFSLASSSCVTLMSSPKSCRTACRQLAAGDQLRVIYDNLSKDPNSLANLDQDLPNYAQHQARSPLSCRTWQLCSALALDRSGLWCVTDHAAHRT